MEQGDHERTDLSKAVRSSDHHLRFVVQSLDGAGGVLLAGSEVVEDELPVLLQRAGLPLHGLDPATEGSVAPAVEEVACPGGGAVLPQVGEVLLEEVGPDGAQVESEQILESTILRFGQVLQ